MSTDRLRRLRYILRKEHIANKKEKGILSRHKTGDEINVLPGTLWEDYKDKQTEKHKKIGFSYFSSLDFENLILSCPPSDVTRINHGEYELLAPISTCADRMKVFEDKAWLGEGLSLDVGSYVHIHRYPNLPKKAPGVIKYKGNLSGIKGLWFGVELLEHRGKGCTNGMFRGHRYFVTDVDCGIFVTIARIRKCQDDNRHDIRQSQQQQQQQRQERDRDRENEPTYQASLQYQASPQQQPQTLRQNATSPPLPNLPTNAVGGLPKDLAGRNYDLKISERVVWLGDTGPEFGCVRWIGTLPDKPEEVLVGVEFTNEVGSGNGRYKEHQLFWTRPNHASLVPILSLMKEDEYINPTPVKMPIGNDSNQQIGLQRREAREVRARFDTNHVKTILDMGYKEALVKYVILQRLRCTGDDFRSTEEMVEALLAEQPNFEAKGIGYYETILQQEFGRQMTLDDPAVPPVASARPISDNVAVPLVSPPMTASEASSSSKISGVEESLKEEIRQLKEQMKEQTMCKICMDSEISMVLVPCGHLVACTGCAPLLRACPICRESIASTVKTFLS